VLSDAFLRDADLHGAHVRRADPTEAFLHGANMRGVDRRQQPSSPPTSPQPASPWCTTGEWICLEPIWRRLT